MLCSNRLSDIFTAMPLSSPVESTAPCALDFVERVVVVAEEFCPLSMPVTPIDEPVRPCWKSANGTDIGTTIQVNTWSKELKFSLDRLLGHKGKRIIAETL